MGFGLKSQRRETIKVIVGLLGCWVYGSEGPQEEQMKQIGSRDELYVEGDGSRGR